MNAPPNDAVQVDRNIEGLFKSLGKVLKPNERAKRAQDRILQETF